MSAETLWKMKEGGWSLQAHCEADHRCNHSGHPILDELIAVFGPDFDIVAERSRVIAALVCSKCESRRAAIILGVPSWAISAGGREGRKTGTG